MKVKKANKADVKVGDRYILNGKSEILKYEYDSDGFLKMGDYIRGEFTNDLVTVTEKPKSYQRSGVMVRFTIPGMEGEYLMFWIDFKKVINIEIEQRISNIDDLLSDKPKPKPKKVKKVPKVKVWTDNQKKRLADPGFYIQYYGEPISTYKDLKGQDFSIIAIGVGKCEYVRTLYGIGEWGTLSWVSSVTKKKLEKDKNTPSGKEYRYLYFKDYSALMKYDLIKEDYSFLKEPKIEMVEP